MTDRIDVEELVERLRALVHSDDHERLTCDARYAGCSCGYEGRKDAALLQAATALSALEKERDEALRTIEGLAWLGEKVTACVDPSGVFHVDGMRREVQAYRTRAQAAETELSALKALVGWLGDQVGLELSWGDDAEEEGSWQVHRVSGSRSDLAWELIASGPTPLEAVQSARSLLSEAKGEGER